MGRGFAGNSFALAARRTRPEAARSRRASGKQSEPSLLIIGGAGLELETDLGKFRIRQQRGRPRFDAARRRAHPAEV